jgi:flagellar biogenesis protein FliO
MVAGRTPMGSYAGYLVETFVTLIGVCLIAFVVLYGARKLGVGRARGPIALLGQLPLDARRQIYLVRVGAQVLVVGVSEAGLSKLGEVPAADLGVGELDTAEVGAPFSDVFARVLGRKPPRTTCNIEASTQPKGDRKAEP